MDTKKEFKKLFYDLHYEEACNAKSEVTLSLEKAECSKKAIIDAYEARGWELFDIETESVYHGTKEVNADWKTGRHGEQLGLVPAGEGSEAAYEEVIGSDGEYHRGKRLKVVVDDHREHWKMHFKRSESNFEKHRANEKKMLELASKLREYGSGDRDLFIDPEVERLERVYCEKHPKPSLGFAIFLMVISALVVGFNLFSIYVIKIQGDAIDVFKKVANVALIVFGVGVLLLILGLFLRNKHKKKMDDWIATQYDVEGNREKRIKQDVEDAKVIESLLKEIY